MAVLDLRCILCLGQQQFHQVNKISLFALNTSGVVGLSTVINVAKTILALHVEAALTRRVSKSSSEILVANGTGKMNICLI